MDIADTDGERPKVAISKQLVMINSASSIFTRLINIFFLLWAYNYLLARISPEEFSVYPPVAAVMVFAPLFSTLMTSGISRYVVDAYAKSDLAQVTKIISSILPILATASLILIALGLTFAWNIGHALTIPEGRLFDARLMMALLVVSFFFQASLIPLSVGFHVRQKFVYLNLIQLAREVFRLLLLVGLLYFVSTRVLWVVVATVSANLLADIATVVISRRLVPELRVVGGLFDRRLAFTLMNFGLWSTIGQLAVMINRAAGTLILNRMATPIDVNSYHVGTLVDHQVRTLTGTASAPAQPALTAMNATGDTRRLANAYVLGGRYALWASLFFACPLIILSKEFTLLYVGERYLDTYLVIILAMITYPLSYSNHMLPMIAVARARIRTFFLMITLTQLLTCALMIWVAYSYDWGAVGIALVSSIVTFCGEVLIFIPMGLRMAGASFERYIRDVVYPGLLPAAIAGVVCLLLKWVVSPDTWFLLIAVGGATSLAYLAALFGLALRPNDREDMAKAVQAVRRIRLRRG